MAPPIVVIASVINTSLNVVINAANNLWTNSVKRESSKAREIRKLSLKQQILPGRARSEGRKC
jgi:hypothetical protein